MAMFSLVVGMYDGNVRKLEYTFSIPEIKKNLINPRIFL